MNHVWGASGNAYPCTPKHNIWESAMCPVVVRRPPLQPPSLKRTASSIGECAESRNRRDGDASGSLRRHATAPAWARRGSPYALCPHLFLVVASLLAVVPATLSSSSGNLACGLRTAGVLRLRGGDRTRWDMFKQLFERFDADKNQVLNRTELRNLLTDVQHGIVPTEHEVGWILKGCELCESTGVRGDDEPSNDVTVTIRQLPPLIKVWFKYLAHKPFIERSLDTFDVSHTDGLLRDELYNFLRHLEGATAPSEGELDLIFSSLDTKRDGNIDRFELLHLISVWYTLITERGQSDQPQGASDGASDDLMTRLADTLRSRASSSNPCLASQQ